MNKLRKQSDTTYSVFFLMVDSADHVTGKTGLSPTVTISKNGGSFASPSGAVSEVGNGLYKIAGNATDSNTVGELWIHATGTGADPTDTSYTIVPFNPFASAIDSNMIQIDGAATSGNNATLKLKSLNLKSDNASIPSLDISGYDESVSGNGGKAISIRGGMSQGVSSVAGDGIFLVGGTSAGGVNRGKAFRMVASGAGGGSGISLEGEMGAPALSIIKDSYTSVTSLEIGLAGSVLGSIGSLATQAKADVNAEVKDVLETDTHAEPSSVPAATASLKDKIGWIFTLWRNKRTQSSTQEKVYADNGTTVIGTSSKSDSGTTFTRGEYQ